MLKAKLNPFPVLLLLLGSRTQVPFRSLSGNGQI
jgi:hypothetical protein